MYGLNHSFTEYLQRANDHPCAGFDVESGGEIFYGSLAQCCATGTHFGAGPGQFGYRRYHSIRAQSDIMRGEGATDGIPIDAIVKLLIGERHGAAHGLEEAR